MKWYNYILSVDIELEDNENITWYILYSGKVAFYVLYSWIKVNYSF